MNKIATGILVAVVAGIILNFLFADDKNNNVQIINNTNQQIISQSSNSNNVAQSNSQSVNINYNYNK